MNPAKEWTQLILCPLLLLPLVVFLSRALTGHSFLSRLGLACEPITDQGLGALTYLTRLTELTLLDGTHLSAERLVSVASRLPRLQVRRVSS